MLVTCCVSWWKVCACYCDVFSFAYVLHMCIFTSCSSVVCVLMALGMFMSVNVMSSMMSVMSFFLIVFFLSEYMVV